MAMTIVENHTQITGGVDTHLEFHVAAAVDANGGVLGVETFSTRGAGYAQLVAWLQRFGPIDRVGVEGTGSYGTGLTRHLRALRPRDDRRGSGISRRPHRTQSGASRTPNPGVSSGVDPCRCIRCDMVRHDW
jgi:transposase